MVLVGLRTILMIRNHVSQQIVCNDVGIIVLPFICVSSSLLDNYGIGELI